MGTSGVLQFPSALSAKAKVQLFRETSVYYNSIFQDAVADKQTVSPTNTPKNC